MKQLVIISFAVLLSCPALLPGQTSEQELEQKLQATEKLLGSASGFMKLRVDRGGKSSLESQGEGSTYLWAFDGPKRFVRHDLGARYFWDGSKGYGVIRNFQGEARLTIRSQNQIGNALDPLAIGYRLDWPMWAPRPEFSSVSDFIAMTHLK